MQGCCKVQATADVEGEERADGTALQGTSQAQRLRVGADVNRFRMLEHQERLGGPASHEQDGSSMGHAPEARPSVLTG